MHIRPRCREWLPLATQQLRLRNLVRIHGFNIECVDRNSLIYYTLHRTADEIEFYKSEPLPARQQQQKWAEISSTEMLKSNLNCVCVKVWMATSDDLCLESSETTNHHHTNEKGKHLLVGDNLDEQKRYIQINISQLKLIIGKCLNHSCLITLACHGFIKNQKAMYFFMYICIRKLLSFLFCIWTWGTLLSSSIQIFENSTIFTVAWNFNSLFLLL